MIQRFIHKSESNLFKVSRCERAILLFIQLSFIFYFSSVPAQQNITILKFLSKKVNKGAAREGAPCRSKKTKTTKNTV